MSAWVLNRWIHNSHTFSFTHLEVMFVQMSLFWGQLFLFMYSSMAPCVSFPLDKLIAKVVLLSGAMIPYVLVLKSDLFLQFQSQNIPVNFLTVDWNQKFELSEWFSFFNFIVKNVKLLLLLFFFKIWYFQNLMFTAMFVLLSKIQNCLITTACSLFIPWFNDILDAI